jgi:hypothetical protein
MLIELGEGPENSGNLIDARTLGAQLTVLCALH